MSVLAIILFGLLLICLVYQSVISIQYLFFAHKARKNPPIQDAQVPVSVVICARNEAKNLRKYLPKVLNQKYFQFEVLVVNDRSWDETEDVLEELMMEYPLLKFTEVPDSDMYFHGKKFAQTLGIKAAQYEHIVFTDADCEPSSDYWLAGMASGFSKDKKICLGYGPYKKKSGLLNALIRFETLNTGVHYLSRAFFGKAYMGVGRNMAYSRALFFKHKGFYKHMHLPSGDDDLFVNEAATSNNTSVRLSKDCLTFSEPKLKWGEWFFQKRRHFTSSAYYTFSSKFWLSLNSFSRLGLYLLTALFIILFPEYYYLPLIALFLYFILRTIALSLFARISSDRDVAYLFVFLDLPLMLIQYALIGFNMMVGKPKVWKR